MPFFDVSNKKQIQRGHLNKTYIHITHIIHDRIQETGHLQLKMNSSVLTKHKVTYNRQDNWLPKSNLTRHSKGGSGLHTTRPRQGRQTVQRITEPVETFNEVM